MDDDQRRSDGVFVTSSNATFIATASDSQGRPKTR